jgi:hypothetical protein
VERNVRERRKCTSVLRVKKTLLSERKMHKKGEE